MDTHRRIVAKKNCFSVGNIRLKYGSNNVNSVDCGEYFWHSLLVIGGLVKMRVISFEIFVHA